MKVRFAVLADYVNVSQEGKINIMGVFDFIHARQFPFHHPEMQLVMRFEADISERGQQKEVEVRLINGHGDEILKLNGRITIDAKPGDLLFNTQILILRNVALPNAGDYKFDIYIDDVLRHDVPLKVVAIQDNPQG